MKRRPPKSTLFPYTALYRPEGKEKTGKLHETKTSPSGKIKPKPGQKAQKKNSSPTENQETSPSKKQLPNIFLVFPSFSFFSFLFFFLLFFFFFFHSGRAEASAAGRRQIFRSQNFTKIYPHSIFCIESVFELSFY